MKTVVFICLILLSTPGVAVSQQSATAAPELPDPKIAFLKSLVLPGWGHRYNDPSDWNRGKYHMATDGMLLLSWLGLKIHSENLRENWFTYARFHADVNIEGRDRTFQQAVQNFENLKAYNDFQLRSRNWDRLFSDIPQNRWNWRDPRRRDRFNDLRNRFETIDNQLPVLLGLMIANRVISGISAYNRARKRNEAFDNATVRLLPSRGYDGVVAHLKIDL